MKALDNIVAWIKSRSREGWQSQAREKWTDLRIWIQEHGEMAAGAAFIVGILLVLVFKLFVAVAVVGLLVAAVIWHVSDPEDEPVSVVEPEESSESEPETTTSSSSDTAASVQDPEPAKETKSESSSSAKAFFEDDF